MSWTPCTSCRSCGSTSLMPVLDLGEQPLANSYPAVDATDPEPRFPLAVMCCRECTLVQLTGTVDPQIMFDDYAYFSSYSDTMVSAMEQLAKRLTDSLRLGPDDVVVEIASNDGYLLKHYAALDVPVLGVEPAANVARVAQDAGIRTVVEYFSAALGSRLAADGLAASVLHANNVMAHVPDINDFVAGIRAVLRRDGTAVVETPYLGAFVADTEFDTIYHEHVFYYSLTAVARLAHAHGLVVTDVERLPIHGGSLRLFLRREGAGAVSDAVTSLLAEEGRAGIGGDDYYRDFARRVADVRHRTREMLLAEKAKGARIAAYGAAAKGTVLLNHFDIDEALVDFVVDRSPHKQGRRMPGIGIPIREPSALVDERVDLVLLLAWNFAEEIIEQQAAFRDAGGRFLVPIPEPRLI